MLLWRHSELENIYLQHFYFGHIIHLFLFYHDKSHYGSLFWFFIFPEGGTEQALISQNVFYVVKECSTLLFTIFFSSMHAVMEIHWDGKYLQPFLGIHPTFCLILPHISKRILRWQGMFVETVIASGHGKNNITELFSYLNEFHKF